MDSKLIFGIEYWFKINFEPQKIYSKSISNLKLGVKIDFEPQKLIQEHIISLILFFPKFYFFKIIFRQVPELTSIRRTVTNRTVGEKPSKLEEIFNDEPKKHPRFIVTVKGYDGRTVQERPTDPFSDEFQERLEDLQKERTPSPTFEEPPKDNNELFVGVENFPAEEEAVKKVARKRPKRADDPCMLVI